MAVATAPVDKSIDKPQTIAVRRTSLGCVSVLFRGNRVERIAIGSASPRAAVQAVDNAEAHVVDDDALTYEQTSLLDRLQQALEGEDVDFSDVALDLSHLGPFARRVAQRCRRIPRGQTMTYAALAAACGSPGAARAVGNTMAKNCFPLIVPCHRVVGAGGSLGGFSAPKGIEFKRQLLEMEGALPKE